MTSFEGHIWSMGCQLSNTVLDIPIKGRTIRESMLHDVHHCCCHAGQGSFHYGWRLCTCAPCLSSPQHLIKKRTHWLLFIFLLSFMLNPPRSSPAGFEVTRRVNKDVTHMRCLLMRTEGLMLQHSSAQRKQNCWENLIPRCLRGLPVLSPGVWTA